MWKDRKYIPSGKHIRRKPQFYLVKLVFEGMHIYFLLLIQNINCGYLLELPRQGSSYVYPQSFFEQNKNIIFFFQLKFVKFTT